MSKYCLWVSFGLHIIFKLLCLVTEATSERGIVYRRYRGVNLQSPCFHLESNVRSLTSCVVLCQRFTSCRTGSHHRLLKTCCLSDTFAFKGTAVYVEDNDSSYFQPLRAHLWYDGWVLAFRAVAGSNIPLFPVWTNVGHHDDAPVGNTDLEFGCLTMNGSRSCRSHFRSEYLDTWESQDINKVSLRLYKDGINKVNLVFNGTGSDVMSWMEPSRVLESPWEDLSNNESNYNLFGVNPIPMHKRYFFINGQYGTCEIDVGWIVAIDVRRPICFWENYTLPAFLYSKVNTSAEWGSADDDTADVLAVFIQF